MNASQRVVASVLHADRQYINAAHQRILELEQENSILRANLAHVEKQYHEIVPREPFAWIEQENVRTEDFVYHSALLRFMEANTEQFEKVLETHHLAWVESENTEAMIAARGDY